MRCPDCNKFVGLEMQDPEVDGLEISADDKGFRVETQVRIVRVCSECGTEMKEATLEISDEVEWTKTKLAVNKEGEPKDSDYGGVEVEEVRVEPTEEGGGRYAKSYFGAEVEYLVKLHGKVIYNGVVSDKVAASEMDEMV